MNEHVDELSTEATNTVACNEEAAAEVWKPLPGYECYYAVSNLGHVYSFKTKTLSPLCLDKAGYYRVYISKPDEGKYKNVHVLLHRLVALTFLPNPSNKPCVDHINTIRIDNRVSNLRWATYIENARNPITLSHMSDWQKDRCQNELEYKQRLTDRLLKAANTSEAKAKRKKTIEPYMEPVICIETGERFASGADAAKAFGVHRNAVYNSVRLYREGIKPKFTKRAGRIIYHFKPAHVTLCL